MMLGCIGGIYAAYTRVETTAEDSCQSGIFKALFVCPLPAVFEMSYVFRFVIGCIQIIYSAFQTGFHDSKVLIGESYVYDDFGFEAVEERHQFHLIKHIVAVVSGRLIGTQSDDAAGILKDDGGRDDAVDDADRTGTGDHGRTAASHLPDFIIVGIG